MITLSVPARLDLTLEEWSLLWQLILEEWGQLWQAYREGVTG